MASEGVYVSLTNDEQRKYRSELLLIQTDVLSLIKKISEVEKIREEKIDQTRKLAQEYQQLITKIKIFNEKMPEPKMPKAMQQPKIKEPKLPKEKKVKMPKEQKKESYNLDDELLEIQRQLKMLTESV